MKLGKQLQTFREAAKITQQEMAETCGLSKNYISALERGVNKINAQTLIAYADKLDVSIDELVGRSQTDQILPALKKILSQMDEAEQQKILHIIEIIRS